MSYLKFDKTQLVNLEYSLPKEILLSNEIGVYCSSTLVGCNTRKYHGLLVAPVPSIDGGKHVLLSNIHETVIQHEQEFNLGISKYPGQYNPKGHKYARWFESDHLPTIVYRVGGVVIQKELLLVEKEARIMIRYTLLEAKSPTKIRIKPFLAFRSIHKLSKTNMFANQRVAEIPNGIKSRLYQEYPDLFIQCSKKAEFVSAPDWYLNIEYSKEKLRGYDYQEDLFVPGYFEMDIKKGQSIVVSAGLDEVSTAGLNRRFTVLSAKVETRKNFDEWLAYAAAGFVRKSDASVEVVPGYHWFGRWGRYALISLPGISSSTDNANFPIEVLTSMIKMMKDGMLPDHSIDINNPVYGSADTSLWFIWALQQLSGMGHSKEKLFKKFRGPIISILSAYSEGRIPGIEVHDNGLVHAYLPGKALTWMDSYVDGQAVTQRPGYAIEINALWYNALSFVIDAATSGSNSDLIRQWIKIKENIEANFEAMFWDYKNGTLYDYVYQGVPNSDVRPNMLLAVSMKYCPLPDEYKKTVLDQVRQELLVRRGIRSLSPRSVDFKPTYEGAHHIRDLAYHQGTVWPWLTGAFAEAWLGIYGEEGVKLIKALFQNFEEDLNEHGIGMISEVYDGNPPHRACGAISFSSSVGELLRVKYLLSKYL